MRPEVSAIGQIRLSRIYDHEPVGDGSAFLVERLWPRGVRREELSAAIWIKEVAPSTALRKWFSHDQAKWDAFRRCYTQELDANPRASATPRGRSTPQRHHAAVQLTRPGA